MNCSSEGVAGNGALMCLAPIPLFFYRSPQLAIEYAGRSARLTHGDRKTIDAGRFYAALIVITLWKTNVCALFFLLESVLCFVLLPRILIIREFF